MRSPLVRRLLQASLVLLLVLHNDLWYWDEAALVMGLPVGLTYHVLFCLVCSALMLLLVKLTWPSGVEAPEGEEEGG